MKKGKGTEGLLSRVFPLDVAFDGLTQEDVDSALLEHRPIPLLFGRFSSDDMLKDLCEQGLEPRLAEKGYHDLRAEIPELAMGQEGVQLTARHDQASDRMLLMELKAYWGHLALPDGKCKALVWDWLELRDPMASFSPERPPLPGQQAPGLSMFHELVSLMRHYVTQTDAEALVTIPQYFHNAVLYQKDPGYRFLDPLRQGKLEAQLRDLVAREGLHAATWAFAEDRVESLAPQASEWAGHAWTPSELVLALHPRVAAALEHAGKDPLLEQGRAYQFRIASRPHPDIEGSFHLAT